MGSKLKKYDIINQLARRYGLKSYLEVCTPSTGLTFGEVDPHSLVTRHRLVYRVQPGVDDGQPYTYRTSSQSSCELTSTIHAARLEVPGYDMIFVDPWHTYRASLEDIQGAWKLLQYQGFMVVHDCNPPSEQVASPDFRLNEWCGETYRAFIDFFWFKPDADFVTVDADYGCAVIRKIRPGSNIQIHNPTPALNWLACADDSKSRYSFFDQNRKALLRLVSPAKFQAEINQELESEGLCWR